MIFGGDANALRALAIIRGRMAKAKTWHCLGPACGIFERCSPGVERGNSQSAFRPPSVTSPIFFLVATGRRCPEVQ